MENNTKKNKRLTEVLIVIVLILNMIFGMRVLFDISGTGVAYKETSLDKQYEVIVRRDKSPKSFENSTVFTSIELYEKDTGNIISYFECEDQEIGEYPEISIEWLDEGVYVKTHTDIWLEYNNVGIILPYQ